MMTHRSILKFVGAVSLSVVAFSAQAGTFRGFGVEPPAKASTAQSRAAAGEYVVAEEKDCWREFSQCEDRCARSNDRHKCMVQCSEDHNNCGR